MTELMEWAAGFAVPRSSDGKPRKARFTAETLPAPAELRADGIRAYPSWRRPNGQAIAIDAGRLTASKEAYRALGLALIAYALSEQRAPLRIHLPEEEKSLAQIVVWPGRESRVEALLGFRQGVREVHYRPRVLQGTHYEPYDELYPREHLPYCTLSPPGWSTGYPGQRPDLPLCLHLAGTSPALVWLGKFLLDISLAESRCPYSYLYNVEPGGESLAEGGAELGLELADPPPDAPDPSAHEPSAHDSGEDADGR